MDRAVRSETSWSSPWCSTQRNLRCILNTNLIPIMTVARVALCSAAPSPGGHWWQTVLTLKKKVSLYLADTGEWCFFDLSLSRLWCLNNHSPLGSNTQPFLWLEESIHLSLGISGAWRLLRGTNRKDNKQRHFPKQVPLEQTANRALLSSGFWLLQGENHC